MADTAQPCSQFWFQIKLEQAEHLRIAVLLAHVNPVVLLNEFMHLARERIGPQPQVVGFNRILGAQLVAAFNDPPMRSSVGNDSYLCVRTLENLWARHERACAL